MCSQECQRDAKGRCCVLAGISFYCLVLQGTVLRRFTIEQQFVFLRLCASVIANAQIHGLSSVHYI